MVDCIICAKHRGEGPLGGELVAAADGFRVYHASPAEDGRASLGHLFIETERHVAYVTELTDDEAGALGRLRTRLARALMDETSVERTFAMVIGTSVAHFHEHVMARHTGTPKEVPWYRSHEAAPRADVATVRDLARRLSLRLPPRS
ncbi:MAG: histidine triad (HIT) protein [Chloroflexi bacterium]|nr:histidine triad (HIT) protein [Chloroflexota bacterium]